MLIHIGGEHGVVYFGPRSDPKRYRYWAERGIIHVEDSADNSYDTISIRQFLQRMRAVSEMLGNSKSELVGDQFAHYDEITRQQNFLDEAVELIRKAREQGLPPSVTGALSRVPVPVFVPDQADCWF